MNSSRIQPMYSDSVIMSRRGTFIRGCPQPEKWFLDAPSGLHNQHKIQLEEVVRSTIRTDNYPYLHHRVGIDQTFSLPWAAPHVVKYVTDFSLMLPNWWRPFLAHYNFFSVNHSPESTPTGGSNLHEGDIFDLSDISGPELWVQGAWRARGTTFT